MPSLAIRKLYKDGETFFESHLDAIKDDIEEFFNSTKIDDDNIQNSGITASTKVIDGSISTAKFAATTVTSSKLADVGEQVSSAFDETGVTSPTLTTITNSAITITTTGRPVMLMIVSDSTQSAVQKAAGASSGSSVVAIQRAGTTIATYLVFTGDGSGTNIRRPLTTMMYVDEPTAGTYTYRLAVAENDICTVGFFNSKLVAWEY